MIDQKLYCETFSGLRASEEAKKEVIQMMKTSKGMRRMPRLLQTAAVIAALTAALAVTAGAVNLATGGELFRSFSVTLVKEDGAMALTDGDGNDLSAHLSDIVVEAVDGRLVLKAMGQEIDITDELTEKGTYHYEAADGDTKVSVDVTGTPDSWTMTATVDTGDGEPLSFTVDSGSKMQLPEGSGTETGDPGSVEVTQRQSASA